MGLDPELMKQLIITFQSELEEQNQLMTDGLLQLEKGVQNEEERIKIIETIFRAAHNIKGASRSLGIHHVADIAHRIETLFSQIKNNPLNINNDFINLCLEAVDKMTVALQAFIESASLPFDMPIFLARLNYEKNNTPTEKNTTEKIEIPEEKPDKPKQETEQAIPKNKKNIRAEAHESIRISVDKIDKIFALLEEIQISKISIEDQYTQLTHVLSKIKEFSPLWKQVFTSAKSHKKTSSHDVTDKVYDTANDHFFEINQVTQQMQKSLRVQLNELTILSNSLQEEIRLLRLVPAANLLRTLPRYVRDLAHELHKEVELNIQGDEVRMDKLVLEGLKDPLMHIIRNAIDHGIENPEIRSSLGKPALSTIKLTVMDEGNRIFITISDDGAGIDINKIAAFIEEKKLATPAELSTMTETDILEFIFRSGFSTKNIITDISGRGVGLDVVKANLMELKGTVSVNSELGKGTTFILSVPLTLSSERGLLIRSSDQIFVIPTNTVKRVLTIQPQEVKDVEGNQILLIDGHSIPLRVLSDVLKLTNQALLAEEKLFVVVIEKGWKTVAFLVDEIIGEREIVVKPLRPPLNNISGISGGTLLEHNQAAVVLNSADLLNEALHINSARRITQQNIASTHTVIPHILVVDDSITTRTLEKNILESKNYQVTIAVNGKEAWELLQKQNFSLLITDINMPLMDGFTLTENVKKHEKLRDLPVIIVTSLGSEAEKARGIEVGANAYIVKNEFESGGLLDIVEQLV
ncbi:MAG: hybrid sensor histidine kinase/response regulator [Gammaproteobacteria bacterium]|nr:hybrid sensor histidine kinase/response regulator [Gammaproteobacteria bacterium]